jgi:cell cycle protein kinase DBF2
MAPEVLHGTPYDHTVDYWSLGCMLFETLVGYPPFAGQTPDDTWRNLKHWKKVLVRPVFEKGSGDEEFNLQDPAWEFITRCISERRDRLQSIEEVKVEGYFTMSLKSAGKLDWDGIRKTTVQPFPQPLLSRVPFPLCCGGLFVIADV